jgi:hypothetical protein
MNPGATEVIWPSDEDSFVSVGFPDELDSLCDGLPLAKGLESVCLSDEKVFVSVGFTGELDFSCDTLPLAEGPEDDVDLYPLL